MWRLDAQDLGDADADLTAALTYKNGNAVYALTPVERAAIHAVYALYEVMLGQPAPGLRPVALDAARQFMHDAYSQVQIGGRLEDLRARILASTQACPYCGFGEVKDLDHYLPRGTYGELAIYPRNLVPSCGPCNNAKRTVYPGMPAAQGPGLVHAYYQPLPDEDFLHADADFDPDGTLSVTFRIDNPTMDPALAAKLQFQLDRLRLNARYRAQVNKYLSEQRAAILMLHAAGEAVFSEFLQRSSAALIASYGRNDWRVALLRTLAADPAFCAAPERYLGPPPA
ncbi:HNH endonuclease [Sphingomonas sp. 22176]|uniref:HNH endonuclease n=1 Tax=Sphingomonas sp. 22176 TaxID=3453884 RepID=UPI003F84164B